VSPRTCVRALGGVLLLTAALGVAHGGERPEPPRAPSLVITAPIGGQTDERVVTIRGTAEGVTAERVTLVLNGVALSIPRSGEAFETVQVLAPGWNEIAVESDTPAGRLADSVSVYARVPSKDLRVTMTWDTPATDVDLWVTGPGGEKVFYSHRQDALGGTLDTDVTTGFGPETFTLARLVRGTWHIQAHYYGGPAPTWVTVTVIEREGQLDERRREFRGLLARAGDVLEIGEVQHAGGA
jgi:uncharacterized protein YfaP (DUF2135 family)